MKLYNFQRKIVLLFIFIFINTINVNAWGSMFSSEEENSDKKTNENAPLDTENVLSSTEITERVAEENNAPKKEVEDHLVATTAEVSTDGEVVVEKKNDQMKSIDNEKQDKEEVEGVNPTKTTASSSSGSSSSSSSSSSSTEIEAQIPPRTMTATAATTTAGSAANKEMMEEKICHIEEVGPIMNVGSWKPSDAFKSCTSLDLTFPAFNDDMIAKLSKSIATHNNIVSVYMSGETPKMTKAGWKALSKAIAGNTNIQTFGIVGNEKIDTESVGAIAREILEINFGVETLDFSGSLLRDSGATEIAKSLSKSRRGLKTLTLSRNEIRSRGGVQVGQAIKRHPTLEELNLDNNIMGDNPVIQLSKKLQTRKAPKIKRLNLSEMNLSVKSMEELSKAIAFSPYLETLNLDGNFRISPSGGKLLAKGLIKNKSLKKIFARYCDFGDVGISELVAAIVEHGNIEYLNVMWNSITNKGASAIATLLRVNRKLKHLNIGKNKINSNGFGLIAAAIENNFVIEEIVFANNAVERDSRIDAFLARNNRRNQ